MEKNPKLYLPHELIIQVLLMLPVKSQFYISKKYYYRGTQHNCKTWQSWLYNATCTALVDKLMELDVEIGWDAKCIFEMDIEDIVEFADDDEKYYSMVLSNIVVYLRFGSTKYPYLKISMLEVFIA
ncbi:RNA polymerase I-specific transcription initiation factor RRN3 [Trifolium repens]|nr:RNA polymerase I-specific transcription initiation factor RRN3 [Trifolium repens]